MNANQPAPCQILDRSHSGSARIAIDVPEGPSNIRLFFRGTDFARQSPLLANILLDDLDRKLERRGQRFVRYADDLLVLVKTASAGQRVMASVTRFVTRHLKLMVNEHKSRVVKTNACVYLGFSFRGTKPRWSNQAFEDFKHRIRKLTGRSWGVSMDAGD